MALDLTNTAADSYFAPRNHVRSALWSRFNEDQKVAALAHATRTLSKHMSKSVEDETVEADIYYHPDRAVFEQALYMLLISEAIPNAELTAPHFYARTETAEDGIRKDGASKYDVLCDEAAGFLNRPKRQIYLVRG
jgi:hypothetical protein